MQYYQNIRLTKVLKYIQRIFKGDIYELLFNNSYVVTYTPMIPVVSLVLAVLTILASSHLNLKIALKISDSSGV